MRMVYLLRTVSSAVITICLVACLPALAATAREQHIVCPSEIRRDAIQIVRAPAGWTPFYLSGFQPGLPLNAAGLARGAPASMPLSRPDWSGRIAGRDAAKWLTPQSSAAYPMWLTCYYGERGQNDAILSRRIDAGASECAVLYPRRAGGAIDIICKWQDRATVHP